MKIHPRKIIRIISLLVLIVCIVVLGIYFIGDVRDASANKKVEELKSNGVTVPDILDDYAGLYAENSDTIGWLKIDGTELDNVVMYVPHDNSKYLHTDFYGNSSYRGCLFVDGDCNVLTSDNIIIYGHHMKDGSMFGAIVDYRSEDFYRQHRYIQFDTIYEKQTYEVIGAITTRLLDEDEEGFRYYEYTGSDDEESFNEYVKFIKSNRLYDTEADLQSGDKLLTLSTCAYHTENGRFIVVAKKI